MADPKKLEQLRDAIAPHITPEMVKDLEDLTIQDVREFATQAGESAAPGVKPASIFTVIILVFAARS